MQTLFLAYFDVIIIASWYVSSCNGALSNWGPQKVSEVHNDGYDPFLVIIQYALIEQAEKEEVAAN